MRVIAPKAAYSVPISRSQRSQSSQKAMKHNEPQFRSKTERENEVRLENNYRTIGISAISAAAHAMKTRSHTISTKPTGAQPLVAAE